MKKMIISLLCALLVLSAFSGCGDESASESGTSEESAGTVEVDSAAATEGVDAVSAGDSDEWDTALAEYVDLDGSSVTIVSAGVYVLTGDISDGQVYIEVGDDDEVQIVLNGVDIYCSSSSCIYVENAGLVTITIAEGSVNVLSDGTSYTLAADEDEPDAAIFSKDDLLINGGGELYISGNYSNGITCKDDLVIESGIITISAVNNAIKGKDSVTITGGTFDLTSGNDGIKATNDSDTEKGYVEISGGTIAIAATGDGIQAETAVIITGGEISIVSGGGSSNASTSDGWGSWINSFSSDDSTDSAKGIKTGSSLEISGGTIVIDSSDDSLHSNGNVEISGGSLEITSGDDGIHGDSDVEISGGEINILQSYEGVEGATVTVSGGTVYIVASDDGINAAGGNDSSSLNRAGANSFTSSDGDYWIKITGGEIIIDAEGDGVDSNGDLYVDGGTVIISGANDSMNGAIDYENSGVITGGTVIAYGGTAWAMNFTSSSTQCSILFTLSSSYSADSEISLTDSDGNVIVSTESLKGFTSVVVSSPEIETGGTYTLYIDGTAVSSVTVTSTITGSSSGVTGVTGQSGVSRGTGGDSSSRGGSASGMTGMSR